MKAEDLKGKTKDELSKALLDSRKEQFNARLQRSSGQLENHSLLRKARRDVARIKTYMNMDESQQAAVKPAAKTKAAPAKNKPAKA